MTKDLSKDPQVVLRRGGTGTGAFGLYIDYVVYNPKDGKLNRQERYFLVDNLLCKYVRRFGNKRAAWRAFPLPTHTEARALLQRNLDRYTKLGALGGIEMIGAPLLVELTSIDVAAVKRNEPPNARHEGSRVAEKTIGKIDDAVWRSTPFLAACAAAAAAIAEDDEAPF